jgi:hypothetical protein
MEISLPFGEGHFSAPQGQTTMAASDATLRVETDARNAETIVARFGYKGEIYTVWRRTSRLATEEVIYEGRYDSYSPFIDGQNPVRGWAGDFGYFNTWYEFNDASDPIDGTASASQTLAATDPEDSR